MIHVALDYYTTTTSHLSFPWKISTPVYTVRNVAIYMHALNGENLMQNSVEKRRSFSCEALGRLNDYYRASIVHIQLHKLVVSVSCSNSFLPGLLTGSKGGQALIEAAICTPLLLHWFCCFHQLPFVSILSLSTSLSLPLSPSLSLFLPLSLSLSSHPYMFWSCFNRELNSSNWGSPNSWKKNMHVCITFTQPDAIILRLCAHNVQWHRLHGM